MYRLALMAASALLVAFSTACAQPAPEAESPPPSTGEMDGEIISAAPRIVPQTLAEVKLSFAPVVERAAPAVVNIYTRRVVQQRSPFAGDPFFERFFGGRSGAPRERVQNSLGSGVIVSPDGVVVTNNHVIDGMTEIKVVLNDRREYNAELVLADAQTDLAVLQIDVNEPLPYLNFANSDSIQVGDVVLAIGNPFGVGQTVTNGIVSALARTAVSVSDYQFFIQTDAAINPGNSGGALIDIDGRLIGVNTAIYSRSGGSNGIGFAIPSRLVQQVIRSAISGNALVRPWIGASSSTVTSDMAKALQLDRPAGAIIDDVWQRGPADLAGIEPGDVVIEVNGQPVYDSATLQYRVGVNSEGDSADIVFLRGGQMRSVAVALQLPPETPARDPRQLSGNHPLNGVSVDNLSPRYSEELGLDPLSTGVVVTEVSRRSFAARRGLRTNHKILSVNGVSVRTSDELEQEILRPTRSWELEIDTGGQIVPWRAEL